MSQLSRRAPSPTWLTALVSLALAWGSLGGTESTAALESGVPQPTPTRALGTLRATIDGTARTWHVVSGTSGGRPYSSGVWIQIEPGRRMLAVGGFDTATPPLDSFTWSAGGMPTSYGDYTGSTLFLNFTVGVDPAPFRLRFPPGKDPAVMYAARATLKSLDTMYGIQNGTVDVTAASVANGLAGVAGTFSGTFKQMVGEGTVAVTGGAFDVSGLPEASTLRR